MNREELKAYYEANQTKVDGAIQWELTQMKRTKDEDSWIMPEPSGGPAILISKDKWDLDTPEFYRANLYPSFEDLSVWYTIGDYE